MNIETGIALLALVISVMSLFVTLYYNKKDHERRRKQATIEYFEDMTSKIYDLEAKFNIGFDKSDRKILELDTNPELLKDAVEILAAFERLSVGINTKIFDIDILDRMAGSYLIDLYSYFSQYIETMRTDASKTDSYIEFERVVNQIKQKRYPLSKMGNI